VKSQAEIREQLQRSLDEQFIVKAVRSPKYSSAEYGFVVAIGAKWVLLCAMADAGYFNGYSALRLSDITRVNRDLSFGVRFAATQPEWPPSVPKFMIDLDTTAGILSALGATDELILIQKEHQRDVTWIGVFDEILGKHVYLHEVYYEGIWNTEPLGYRLRAITRIAIGDRYMRALAEIVGPRPAKT
jgi:hypothetical protein